MTEPDENLTVTDSSVIEMAADIVSAYVSNNAISPADLPRLIGDVYAALAGVNAPAEAAPVVETPKPAVPIKKSITPDYLISLEDGKSYKSLRRHLRTRGMTPDDYRRKWALPADYPMTAPSYSARRSELARSLGLGRKAATAPEPAPSKPGPRRKTKGANAG